MAKLKIKKGDQVLVLAGRSRGHQGKVLRVMPSENRAIVEGANLIRKTERPNPQKQVKGGVLETEGPIHVSNLMLIDPEGGKPTRVGRKRLEDGSGVRVAKASGATFN